MKPRFKHVRVEASRNGCAILLRNCKVDFAKRSTGPLIPEIGLRGRHRGHPHCNQNCEHAHKKRDGEMGGRNGVYRHECKMQNVQNMQNIIMGVSCVNRDSNPARRIVRGRKREITFIN